MQGTALLSLIIKISIAMLLNSLPVFYPWKKINSNPRSMLTKIISELKKHRKVDVVGTVTLTCDRMIDSQVYSRQSLLI